MGRYYSRLSQKVVPRTIVTICTRCDWRHEANDLASGRVAWHEHKKVCR